MRFFVLLPALLLACGGGAAQEPARAEAESQTNVPETVRVRHDIGIDGHQFALWEKSPPNPKGVLVLVHGRTWSSVPDFDLQVPGERRSLMDALASEGFATYAIDQRGYGETKRDHSGWLTPDRAAKDLAETLRWVRVKSGMRPSVLGWSYGSMVSHLCLQRNPELADNLILYGYPRGVDSTYTPGPAEGVAAPRNATTAEGAAEDFIAPGATSPATVKAFVAQALASDPIRVDWRERQQWAELDAAKIKNATLLMHGEQDPYAPVARQAAFFARIASPDKQWVVLPGGDHAAHLESTGPQFVHALVAFLDRRPIDFE
jgi:pimeloyl-ACP methyl ester carboxylesterase